MFIPQSGSFLLSGITLNHKIVAPSSGEERYNSTLFLNGLSFHVKSTRGEYRLNINRAMYYLMMDHVALK